MTRRVAVVDRTLPDYRTPVLKDLAKRLSAYGVELTVFAGATRHEEGFVDGIHDLPCGVLVKNWNLFGRIYWQNIFTQLWGYDLVIVEQANSALLNYALIVSRYVFGRPRRISYWGHGVALRGAGQFGFRRWLKDLMVGAVDHWFAYTNLTYRFLIERGYPAGRITVANNSIDVSDILVAVDRRNQLGRERFRDSLNFGHGPMAVYCSRLYDDKRIDFLLEAAGLVRAAHPEFELLLIGDGPDRPMAEAFAREAPWVKLLGLRYGSEKAAYIVAADVMMLPSACGLSVLDAFAARLPLLTADFHNHGPEIEYLETGRNGLMAPPTASAYAAEASALLADKPRMAAMSVYAGESAGKYSLAAMVDNLTGGILQALAFGSTRKKV